MEEPCIKISKLNGQLLKLDSLLLAINADTSATVLHCYGDLHCLLHLISCSTTVCTEFVWLLAPTLPYSLDTFFALSKNWKYRRQSSIFGLTNEGCYDDSELGWKY